MVFGEKLKILSINGGSSSIKFALFDVDETLPRIVRGSISQIGMIGSWYEVDDWNTLWLYPPGTIQGSLDRSFGLKIVSLRLDAPGSWQGWGDMFISFFGFNRTRHLNHVNRYRTYNALA